MSSRAGYSLFEVLIAFAILTTVLSALIPGQARLLARVTEQDNKFLAQDYAYSRMAQIGITDRMETGHKMDSYRTWNIAEEISQITLDDSDIELLKVIIEVQSASGAILARVESLRAAQ